MEFTNTISLLLSSGLTFKDSLEIAQTIFLKGQVNEIIVALLEEIRKGRSVYQVLDDFGTGFPPIFKGFIKIGEKMGSLEGAFKKLAEYLTEDRKLKSKLASSLIYPVLVISVAVIGIIGIVVFILPKIGEMFSQLGSGLPRRLESMINMLNYSFIIGTILISIVVLSILILSIIRKRNKVMAEKLDRLFLRLPVLGRIKYLKEILNFLFAMETLTGGGFNVEDALLESGKVVENLAFRSGIRKARDSIIKGESLSVSFSRFFLLSSLARNLSNILLSSTYPVSSIVSADRTTFVPSGPYMFAPFTSAHIHLLSSATNFSISLLTSPKFLKRYLDKYASA
ncbi:hypothetical protein ES705_49086 [subsurface metagenome]